MKKIYFILLLMLLVPAIVVAKIITYEDPINKELNLETSSTSAEVKIRILDADKVKSFYLELEENELNKDKIKIKDEDYIILNVKGKTSFLIPDLNISVDLKENKQESIRFDAPNKGDYDFYLDEEKGNLKVKRTYF
ncbi:MAG: hypothetical protein KKA65_03960 [Nanoarchaeota archaeon]|nr:hypothetical protein [Nanoarchaeota archaeon]MBU4242227.1 hypothetical protein [Nanoarchaeota archaeon]MBU4351591.1 hypothetical protein [Nanoarchaeota archaeon]MBU4456632.1 hypothetical protein [Nanoarchaeota archaeon]MCG2719505.1 hypothetical protein [Nanoarchaeota archaeon]